MGSFFDDLRRVVVPMHELLRSEFLRLVPEEFHQGDAGEIAQAPMAAIAVMVDEGRATPASHNRAGKSFEARRDATTATLWPQWSLCGSSLL